MRYHLLISADIAVRGSRCDKAAHRDITVPDRGAAYKTVIHLLYLPPLSPAGTSLKTRCNATFFCSNAVPKYFEFLIIIYICPRTVKSFYAADIKTAPETFKIPSCLIIKILL